MKRTEQSLLEQMRINGHEIRLRNNLFFLEDLDFQVLKEYKQIIIKNLDAIVDRFYTIQTSNVEISLLIGDKDTLRKLKNAQRAYITDLFSGVYDLEYVNNRLRIGLVHKRIGVEPKLYLSAVYLLSTIIKEILISEISDKEQTTLVLNALEKLLWFDITLVFDTYIRSLVSEIEISREKSENYSKELEETVLIRTNQLEKASKMDPLTRVLNRRTMDQIGSSELRKAQRKKENITLLYLDLNDFKKINDKLGHQEGDRILQAVGGVLNKVSRIEDSCFRIGGDEFIMVLPSTDKEGAMAMIQKIKKEIKKTIKGEPLSIGYITTEKGSEGTFDELLSLAEEQMYKEKKEIKK